MKRTILWGVVVLLLGLTGLYAQDTAEPPFKAPVYRGAITTVNASSMNVKDADDDMTFALNAETRVIGAKKAVAELAVGDRVTVTYKTEGGKNIATHVRVAAK